MYVSERIGTRNGIEDDNDVGVVYIDDTEPPKSEANKTYAARGCR